VRSGAAAASAELVGHVLFRTEVVHDADGTRSRP
jgi:hypothetical protein